MTTHLPQLMSLIICVLSSMAVAEELDRRCSKGDCVVLEVEKGRVFARRIGEFAGRRQVGTVAKAGGQYVRMGEAAIRYASTASGWRAAISAFLPSSFDYNAPELRLYLIPPSGKSPTVVDDYNTIENFQLGRILKSDQDFLLLSTSGAHAYVVRTRVWLLPKDNRPTLVLDLPATLEKIQSAKPGSMAGLWLRRQLYDGVNAATKQLKQEFWAWSEKQDFELVH